VAQPGRIAHDLKSLAGAGQTNDGTPHMKDNDRPAPPYAGDERATLTGFLDFQRATLEWKCDGLADEQLRQRAVPTSAMSLIGIVRHLADVEQHWFRVSLDGQPPSFHYWYRGPDGSDLDWEVETADVAESFGNWRQEVDHARRIVAASESLDRQFDHPHDGRVTLRWVLTHMIEEYARHNGHADLLREAIDGAVGE
jgi:uncharacterized damage-inducible protein DinB